MTATRQVVLALVLLSVPHIALAEEPLQVKQVLSAVANTHPKMDAAHASVEIGRGRRLAARRALEPKVGIAASTVPAGYYDYWQLSASVEQRIPSTGIKLLGGYRLGRGDIPVYYGERETRDGGELFAKVEVPLLADRSIDKERAEIAKTELAATQASFALESTWLNIARKASLAYWEWAAAGQKLRVAKELLAIAQERSDRIHKQAASGAYPTIAVVDAERVVFSRQSKLLQARGTFVSKQQKLSLFYRSAEGVPVIVDLERVPETLDELPNISSNSVEAWSEAAIARRPELKVANSQRQQAKVDQALAKNLSLPSLDANGFVARDLGSGSESLGRTDIGMGLTLSIPLFQREGRGMKQQARGKLAIIEAKQRGLRDRIRASIQQSAQLAILAQERRVVALSHLSATERLAAAERERVRQGASDLLTLNLRELDVAMAANEVIESSLAAHRAIVELAYSRGAIAPGVR